MGDFSKQVQSDLNAYRDSLLYTKTCAVNCPSEETGLVQVYKNFILEEVKPAAMGN